MDRWYCNGLYGINSPTYKLQLTAVQEHIYCNSGLNVRPENIVITACTNVYTNEEQRSPCTRHSKSAHFDKTQSETNTFPVQKNRQWQRLVCILNIWQQIFAETC